MRTVVPPRASHDYTYDNMITRGNDDVKVVKTGVGIDLYLLEIFDN